MDDNDVAVDQLEEHLVCEIPLEHQVYLNGIDEFLLKQIVKKFSFRSGGKFYRSCRGAKELVDSVQPAWLPPYRPFSIFFGYGHDDYDHLTLVLTDLKTNCSKYLSLRAIWPNETRDLGAAFLGEELYFFGGVLGVEPLKSAYKLNKNLEWEQLPDMHEKRGIVIYSSVVFNGEIWVMGGGNGQGDFVVRTVEAYDSASNSWVRKPSMSYKRENAAAAVVSGKIFICGGSNVEAVAVEYFDPLLSRWILCTPLPTPRCSLTAAVHGSSLIVVGGNPVNGISIRAPTNEVWIMNVEEANPQWTRMPPLQTGREHPSVVMFGGNLVVTGGQCQYYSRLPPTSVERFDGKTWNWGKELPCENDRVSTTYISEEFAQKLLKKYSN